MQRTPNNDSIIRCSYASLCCTTGNAHQLQLVSSQFLYISQHQYASAPSKTYSNFSTKLGLPNCPLYFLRCWNTSFFLLL